MHEASIVGIGTHPFGRWPGKTTVELAEIAIAQALSDAGVAFREIQEAWLGAEFGGYFDARTIIQNFGWTGIPISQMQQACASGSAALREAVHAVRSGRIQLALVVGYEKMEGGLITGGDPDRDGEHHLHRMGLDLTPARIAMAIRRRMEEVGDTAEMLAIEAAQCFEYGALNPLAQFRKRLSVEDILNSPQICSPLTRYMCCANSDGAAALVIAGPEISRRLGSARAVRIAASVAGSPDHEDLFGGPGAHIGGDFRSGRLTRRVASQAYEAAGVGPEDVDAVQCHAPFAGGAALCAEALGFCAEGEGGQFFAAGHARHDGRTPINTDGGLLARGHPLGATGVAEIGELVRQLRGEGGALQIPGQPRVALAHNTGLGCLNMHILMR